MWDGWKEEKEGTEETRARSSQAGGASDSESAVNQSLSLLTHVSSLLGLNLGMPFTHHSYSYSPSRSLTQCFRKYFICLHSDTVAS